MTAADTVPPIRLDRYLALLAILMALVLGLLVIGERQKEAALPEPVVGSLPPPPDPRLAALIAERESLLAEQARLAEALATTESALRRAEAETAALAEENERLRQMLGDEGAELDDLTGRLAAAETERDRLSVEVQTLSRARQQLEARIAELETAQAAPESPPLELAPPESVNSAPAAPALSTTDSTRLPTTSSPGSPAAQGETPAAPDPPTAPDAVSAISDRQPSSLAAAVAELRRDQSASAVADPPTIVDLAEPLDLQLSAPDSGSAGSIGRPRRLTTFSSDGSGTLEEGIVAYNAGDYVNAERIWGQLAAAGDARGAFYFGSILSEGRNAPPDRVMAHVWLSRSVDAGYLPAIEVRRQVRAAMSEAEYEEAVAIQADS
jgi:hypothetical protein